MARWTPEEAHPQPPYKMRPLGPTYRRLLAQLGTNDDRHLINCSVCEGRMMTNAQGAHVRCLAGDPEPYQAPGPYLDTELIGSAPWLAGIDRSAREAAEAKAAEAVKAAMPVPDSDVSTPEAPAACPAGLAELKANDKRAAAALGRKSPKCRVCKLPITQGQANVHAMCTSPRDAWPNHTLPTSKRKAKKSLEDAFSPTSSSGPQWTDWAAALSAAGLTDGATLPADD